MENNNYYHPVTPGVCPTCGKCPTCGAYGYPQQPYITWTTETIPEQIKEWMEEYNKNVK